MWQSYIITVKPGSRWNFPDNYKETLSRTYTCALCVEMIEIRLCLSYIWGSRYRRPDNKATSALRRLGASATSSILLLYETLSFVSFRASKYQKRRQLVARYRPYKTCFFFSVRVFYEENSLRWVDDRNGEMVFNVLPSNTSKVERHMV